MRKVLHISTGAPGITDAKTGIVLSAPNLKTWDNVPLCSMLQDETGVSCSIENDTNLAAVGEHWRGVAADADNFVFIALGTGVGAGIFLEGKLYHGAQCSAGEIGYLSVGASKREPIRVHQTGQLERAIGGKGIEQEWIRLLKSSGQSLPSELLKLRPTQIFDLARDGDQLAIQVVNYMACILADAIANIALLLNPELVILGGGVGCHEQICCATERLVRQHEFAQPKLRSSSLGTQAQLYGAISIALSAVEGQLLQ